MKRSNFLNHTATRLMALLLCMTAAIPLMRADNTYVVAGEPAAVFGETWNTTLESKQMTNYATNCYMLIKSGCALDGTTIKYKIVGDGSNWYGNSSGDDFEISGYSGTYDVIFRFYSDNTTYQAYQILQHVNIAGSSGLMGYYWNTNQNQMTAGTTSYTLTLSNVSLSKDSTYYYKAVIDGSTWYGQGGDNYQLTVSESGTYDVTFDFNPNTNVTTVSTTLIAADPHYYITGDASLGLDGWSYSPSLELTDADGDGIYTYTTTATTSGYHNFVFANDQGSSWDDFNNNYRIGPTNGNEIYTLNSDYTGTQMAGGDNGSYTVAAGAGDVTFYFNPTSMEFQVVGTEATTYDYTFYVKLSNGNTPNLYLWDSNQTAINGNSPGNAMSTLTYLSDGSRWYMWTGSLATNVVNAQASGIDSDENRVQSSDFTNLAPGTYYITLDMSTGESSITTEDPSADPTMYLIGYAGSQQWAANAGTEMTYDETTGIFTLSNVVLTANSEFAFASKLGSSSDDWTTLNQYRLSSNGDSHWAINETYVGTWLDYVDYENDNHNWYVTLSGAYNIYVDPTNEKVKVESSYNNMYMSYGVNWTYSDNSVQMTTVDGNIYQTTIELTNGDYFLFSTAKSDTTAWGAASDSYEITDAMIGYAQTLEENSTNNYYFSGTTGTYVVVVNKTKGTVTLRKTVDGSEKTVTKIYLQKTDNVTLDADGGTYNNQTLDGVRGGIYAWNKLNLQSAGRTYSTGTDGPTNYTYEGEVGNYGGDGYLTDLSDTTTVDNKQWYAWSVANSICEFYFIRNNQTDYKSQNVMRRAGEVWLTWIDEDATSNRQSDAAACDSLQDVTRDYYAVSASGVSDCATMLEGHYYVYYTNTTGWDSVYCYAWYEDANTVINCTGTYPGSKCTFVGYDEDGYEVWCYDFGLISELETVPTNIIFDNGRGGASEGEAGDAVRQQTGDMPFSNGGCYDYLGLIYLGNSLNAIINNGVVNGPKYTVEDNLIGVYYDDDAITEIDVTDENGDTSTITVKGALYAKDYENYSAKSTMPSGTTDYVYGICAHTKSDEYPGGSQIQLKRTSYDQSNWVKIILSPNFDNTNAKSNGDVTYEGNFDTATFATANENDYLQSYVGHIIPAHSMSGNLVNNVNPQMHITNIAPAGSAVSYEKNVYVTGHFNDTVVFTYTHQNWNPGTYEGVHRTVPVITTDENGNQIVERTEVVPGEVYKMFYVAPKPQEVAFITWAVFDHPNVDANGNSLNIGTGACDEEPSLPGAFYAPMNWDRTGYLWEGSTSTDPYDQNAAWGTTYGPYSNGYMQYGAFQVNWSLYGDENHCNSYGQPWYKTFKPGQAYKIMAIIRYAYGDDPVENPEYSAGVIGSTSDAYNEGPGDHVMNAPRRANDTWADMNMTPYDNLNASKFIVFPLLGSSEDSNGNDMGNVTAVEEVKVAPTSQDILSVDYYNLMGVKSDKPFDGINIVVTTYSDGSRTSKKILR